MTERARTGADGLELPASLFEALGRPRTLSLTPHAGNLAVRRDGALRALARRARDRGRSQPARLRDADASVARYATSLALPEATLGIANYERFLYLMPVGDDAERAGREQSWGRIEDYHEHRPLELQGEAAHRVSEWLAREVLLPLGAGASGLELGCGAGRNLRALAAVAPDAALHGLDVNEAAVEEARRNVPRASIRTGSLYELGDVAADSVEVVFTSGVLMHVPGDDVEEVVRQMHRIAARAVVHFELHGPSHPFDFHRYPRDYAALYARLGLPVERYTVFPRGDHRSTSPSFHHALLVSSLR